MKTISAGLFKAKCLALLDEVKKAHETIVVTKRGIPVAKVAPVDGGATGKKSSLRGSVLREKDIISPVEDTWEADH